MYSQLCQTYAYLNYILYFTSIKNILRKFQNDDLYVHESGIIEIFVINFEQIGFPLFQMAKNMQ